MPRDAAELAFTRPKEAGGGAGPLNREERTGFFQHAQLAVTPERLPLGVPDAGTRGRDADDHGKHVRRQREPIERKESSGWLEGHRRACAVAAAVPGTLIVSIADREGDIYECPAEARTIGGPRAEWIIRSCQDRSTTTRRSDEGDRSVKLRDTMAARPVLGRLTVHVPRSEKGPARAATMTVRSASAELKPPDRPDRKRLEVTVNAVLIREESPRAGSKPIEWLLLTGLPVATFAEAATVVDYYSGRWPVGLPFRIHRTGCRVEEIRPESEDRLLPCLALYLIVAWRAHRLTMPGRSCPRLPCAAVLADEERRGAWTIVRREPAPEAAPPSEVMIRLVASPVGYLGRQHDGPPRAQVLWIGLQRMREFALAWRAFGPRPAEE